MNFFFNIKYDVPFVCNLGDPFLLQVTVACDLVLNPKNNTILSQECGF